MRSLPLTTVLLIMAAAPAMAAVLEFSGTPAKKIEASGQEISIAPVATVKLPKLTLPALKLTGAGVRTKKVVLVKVNVYAVASYVDGGVALDAADPMASVRKAKVKALQLTFLRDVDAGKIRGSFADALKTNGVDLASPAMKQVMEKLTFDVKEKSTLTLVGYKKDEATEVLVFEGPAASFSVEGPGVASTFWQIWFGIPEDGGLESLKESLVGRKG